MSSFAGFVSFNHDLPDKKDVLKHMMKKLSKFKEYTENYYSAPNVILASQNINNNQLMSIKFENNIYTILYNGTLYNAQEICEQLKTKGYIFISKSDTEVLLKAFIEYRK